MEEVKKVLFSMEPLKAPGKDNMDVNFLQKTWQTTGPNIYHLVLNTFNGQPLSEGMLSSLVTLIPKMEVSKSCNLM